jgi:hypothetical protein
VRGRIDETATATDKPGRPLEAIVEGRRAERAIFQSSTTAKSAKPATGSRAAAYRSHRPLCDVKSGTIGQPSGLSRANARLANVVRMAAREAVASAMRTRMPSISTVAARPADEARGRRLSGELATAGHRPGYHDYRAGAPTAFSLPASPYRRVAASPCALHARGGVGHPPPPTLALSQSLVLAAKAFWSEEAYYRKSQPLPDDTLVV